MKKILYIGGFELPDKNAAAQRVVANSKALEKLGYEILFLGITKNKRNIEYQFFENFKYLEIEYPQNLFQWLKYLSGIEETIKIIEKNEKIEGVICYNYPAIALYRLEKYCRKKNIKIFADVTEWYQGEGNLIKKIIKNIDSYLRMVKIHPKLDGLIVISKYLENFYKNKLKTIYIPPLVDLCDKKWHSNTNIKILEDKLVLIYAGNPGKIKDKIDKVVSAVERINSDKIILKIIGLTKEEFKSTYSKDFKDLNSNIIFLGRISHEKVLKLLKEADFSIFFRERNRVTMAGFPTKFVESMSAKVPVITTKTSDLEDYLLEGKNGFWLKDNIEDTLKEILNNKFSDLKSMKENIKVEEFDYRNYIEKFSELFCVKKERE